MKRTESERSKPIFQFRIASLLGVVIVVAAFFGGMQYQRAVSHDPGVISKPSVALVGALDVDGDGISDVDKLQKIIYRNGGTVVACQDSRGRVLGTLDSQTNYLVMGSLPKIKKD